MITDELFVGKNCAYEQPAPDLLPYGSRLLLEGISKPLVAEVARLWRSAKRPTLASSAALIASHAAFEIASRHILI